MRHCRNVSNRSVFLTYQLRRWDDVSAWSRTLKLVSKIDQFLLDPKTVHFSQTTDGSASLKYQLIHHYNISKTSVSFRYYVQPPQRVKLVSPTGFIFLLIRRHKDVTNRSVSFTYKLWRHVDDSAWFAINGVLRAVFNIRMEQNVSWSSSCLRFRWFSCGEKSSWQSEGVSYARSHLTKEFYRKKFYLFMWK